MDRFSEAFSLAFSFMSIFSVSEMSPYIEISKLTKGDIIGRLRGMTVEDLHESAVLEFELANDDGLISSLVTCVNHADLELSMKICRELR